MLADMKMLKSFLVASLALAAMSSFAQVKIEGAWARPTVQGQQAGGGYLSITSAAADRLLGGSTQVAQQFGGGGHKAASGAVMEMRQVDAIELPAGKKVELKPGGLHVMFIGLKAPLKVGDKVPVTLKFEKAGELKVDFAVTNKPAEAGHKH